MDNVLREQISIKNEYRINPVNTTGKYKSALFDKMKNTWDIDKLNKLFVDVSLGLTKFYDPQASIDKVIKILCLGKVQSGKTAFFISTIAMAMDNGYSLFYVIGGTKNNLLNQNRNRIQDEFSNNDDVFIMDINDCDTDDIKSKIKRGYKVILTILKNKNKSTTLNLSELERITKELNCYPSIIVDDEGDEYSQANELDDNPLKQKKIKTKAIHNSLKNCIENMKKGVYLSVTATPQSNLLVSTLNTLSPDDCILVEPGKGYTGASVFHETLDNEFVVVTNDCSDFVNCVPDTFKEALRYFLIGCAVRKYRNNNECHTMLVHPSAFISIHEDVAKKVNNELNSIIKNVQNPKCLAYDTIKTQFEETFNKYKNEFIGEIEFDEIWKYIDKNLDKTKVVVINGNKYGDVKKNDNLKQVERNYKYIIYIGGAMLERGITLKNLAVTYIYRQAKIDNADTLFQRARWFGYKEDYIDLCKVYMPYDLAKKFVELNDHEVHLWYMIKQFLKTGLPMQKMERLFLLGDNKKLRLTRNEISRTIISYRNHIGYVYDKAIDFSEENRINNLNLYRLFIENNKSEMVFKSEGNHKNGYLIIKYTKFFNDFINKYKFPQSSSKINYDFFKNIFDLVNDNVLPDECQIIDMKIGEDISRSLSSGGNFIKELPQGYNKGKSIYVGDKEIGIEKLSIQFHCIYTNDINKKYLLLAVNSFCDETFIKYVTGDNYYES